ncbi:MAG: 2'-5' RNA ligase family protein [candidate division Zixibacteria bacterium]|nr:2'-5' RNA ligase family protein [candidate division Zixibacteria bacterium]
MSSNHSGCRTEAALVVLVPEAETLVGPFRKKYDKSAAEGAPAHITINYPFSITDPTGQYITDELAKLFSSITSFQFALTEVRRFPNVLYLAPEPIYLFQKIIHAVAGRFPDSPPYGGHLDEVIPHLTVAEIEDPGVMKKTTGEFKKIAGDILPIRSVAGEVSLMIKKGGRWQTRMAFQLAPNL